MCLKYMVWHAKHRIPANNILASLDDRACTKKWVWFFHALWLIHRWLPWMKWFFSAKGVESHTNVRIMYQTYSYIRIIISRICVKCHSGYENSAIRLEYMILGNYYHSWFHKPNHTAVFLPDITKTHFSFTKTRYTNF